MHYWVLFTLLIVVGVKYYTSIEMRKLERRPEKVKNDLQQVKGRLQAAQDRSSSVEMEEHGFEERVRRMKETIEDMQTRLTAKEGEEEEKVIVSDSTPSARPF